MVEHRFFHVSPWGTQSCGDLLGELPPFIMKVIVVEHLLCFSSWEMHIGWEVRRKESCVCHWAAQTQEMSRCVEIKHISNILIWW